MNSLQPWLKQDNFFVSLNNRRRIREELIWDQVSFDHPVFDTAALDAQAAIAGANGTNKTWFCGAWMNNGFHEDGFASAMNVVEQMASETAFAVAAE